MTSSPTQLLKGVLAIIPVCERRPVSGQWFVSCGRWGCDAPGWSATAASMAVQS